MCSLRIDRSETVPTDRGPPRRLSSHGVIIRRLLSLALLLRLYAVRSPAGNRHGRVERPVSRFRPHRVHLATDGKHQREIEKERDAVGSWHALHLPRARLPLGIFPDARAARWRPRIPEPDVYERAALLRAILIDRAPAKNPSPHRAPPIDACAAAAAAAAAFLPRPAACVHVWHTVKNSLERGLSPCPALAIKVSRRKRKKR